MIVQFPYVHLASMVSVAVQVCVHVNRSILGRIALHLFARLVYMELVAALMSVLATLVIPVLSALYQSVPIHVCTVFVSNLTTAHVMQAILVLPAQLQLHQMYQQHPHRAAHLHVYMAYVTTMETVSVSKDIKEIHVK